MHDAWHDDGHRRDFRAGIPGDYFEQVDGTYVEPPVERARRERLEREEQERLAAKQAEAIWDAEPEADADSDGDSAPDVPAPGSPTGATAEMADRLLLSDALLRVRLASNALTRMCRVISEERDGVCMTASFMPPYSGDDVRALSEGRGGEPPFGEWVVQVNGEPAAMGCYEKLCEVWADGPEAMHEWLEDVISWDIAAEALMDTLSEIFRIRRADGADEGDGYRSIFATPDEWDKVYESVDGDKGDGPGDGDGEGDRYGCRRHHRQHRHRHHGHGHCHCHRHGHHHGGHHHDHRHHDHHHRSECGCHHGHHHHDDRGGCLHHNHDGHPLHAVDPSRIPSPDEAKDLVVKYLKEQGYMIVTRDAEGYGYPSAEMVAQGPGPEWKRFLVGIARPTDGIPMTKRLDDMRDEMKGMTNCGCMLFYIDGDSIVEVKGL